MPSEREGLAMPERDPHELRLTPRQEWGIVLGCLVVGIGGAVVSYGVFGRVWVAGAFAIIAAVGVVAAIGLESEEAERRKRERQ